MESVLDSFRKKVIKAREWAYPVTWLTEHVRWFRIALPIVQLRLARETSYRAEIGQFWIKVFNNWKITTLIVPTNPRLDRVESAGNSQGHQVEDISFDSQVWLESLFGRIKWVKHMCSTSGRKDEKACDLSWVWLQHATINSILPKWLIIPCSSASRRVRFYRGKSYQSLIP